MICAPVTWLRQELFSPLPRVSTTRAPSHLHRAARSSRLSASIYFSIFERPATLYHRWLTRFRSLNYTRFLVEKIKKEGCL